MSFNRRLFLNIGLLLFVLLSCWLIIDSAAKTPNSFVTSPDKPDTYMENIIATQTDKTGKIKNVLYANSIYHYDDTSSYAKQAKLSHSECYKNNKKPLSGDVAKIDKPVIFIYANGVKSWKVKSKTANAINNFSSVTFNKNVVLNKLPGTNHQPETTLYTDAMTACPNNNYAYTNNRVKIVRPGNTVSSTGASANMNTNTIELRSKASSEYDPNVTNDAKKEN